MRWLIGVGTEGGAVASNFLNHHHHSSARGLTSTAICHLEREKLSVRQTQREKERERERERERKRERKRERERERERESEISQSSSQSTPSLSPPNLRRCSLPPFEPELSSVWWWLSISLSFFWHNTHSRTHSLTHSHTHSHTRTLSHTLAHTQTLFFSWAYPLFFRTGTW